MNIILLIARDGYSFVNQANGLAAGLSELGINNKIIRLVGDFPVKEVVGFKTDLIIGIGSWHSYPDFVEVPESLGIKYLPWIVSDDKIDKYIDEYNRLKFFLTTSKHCKKVFVDGGIISEKIGVLPEAVDNKFWKEIGNRKLRDFIKLISVQSNNLALPLTYDLEKIKKEKIPILFTTGGDATSKGAQEVISALAMLPEEVKWIYMIKTWPSSGSFGRSIEELVLAERLGVLNRIRYISGEFSFEFIRNLMNLCDVYVAPSRGEGFGLPLVEAQLCGKPVITMMATSTQEIVENNITGLVSKATNINGQPRADIEDLSKILLKILTDESLRRRLGRKAKIKAVEKFSPRNIASVLVAHINYFFKL